MVDANKPHKVLSVPDNATGKRKTLEFPSIKLSQDRQMTTNFFGMRNEYLVYFHAEEEHLMVADFRPLW